MNSLTCTKVREALNTFLVMNSVEFHIGVGNFGNFSFAREPNIQVLKFNSPELA